MIRKYGKWCGILLLVLIGSALMTYLLIPLVREVSQTPPRSFAGRFTSDVGELVFTGETSREAAGVLRLSNDAYEYRLYFSHLDGNVYQYKNNYFSQPEDWIAVLCSEDHLILFKDGVLIGDFRKESGC